MTRRNPNHLSARYDGAWDTHRRHETKANWIYFRREPPSIGNRDTTVPVTQCNRPCHVTRRVLFACASDYRVRRDVSFIEVCVFITAGPITKLFAGGGGGEWTTCAMFVKNKLQFWDT